MSNPIESGFRRIHLPIAPDRRKQDRVITHLPIRIVSVDGIPAFHPAMCINLSRGGIGFETPDRLDVGKVVEFEFVRVIDEAVHYWVKILFRDGNQYGGYYVNDDGTDIRPTN
ncbi:MAG TPA: PilZ domain-containing protein [Terriglobales bacterium]